MQIGNKNLKKIVAEKRDRLPIHSMNTNVIKSFEYTQTKSAQQSVNISSSYWAEGSLKEIKWKRFKLETMLN